MSLNPGDPRLEWLGERVAPALDVSPEEFKHLLNEKHADRPAKERFLTDLDGSLHTLKRFFSADVKSGTAVFFFPAFEDVEEEYQVEEEVIPTAAGEGEGPSAEGAEGEGQEAALASEGEAPPAPAAAVEPPTAGEGEAVLPAGEGEEADTPAAPKVVMVTKTRVVRHKR